ncbi:MAG TPA: GNAT family N-acetyltransferase [Lacibacter sp.]|nr:GNAT family N-acetyltransferase [Lacibacter sp.]HMO89690.1 GNAT family N-acetyltransferase [Lacibacter sp.]HMP87498.1 GNAT family N-acetyltransferase [Lacibacter sp.]
MEWIISPAVAADIPALVTLVNSAYRGETSRQGWTTEADLLEGTRTDAEHLLEEMQAPGVTLLKLEDEKGQLSACVYLQVQNNHELYLGMLTVAPHLQNKGLGKLLLQEAEQRARSNGLSAIVMTVITDRAELIAWYRRHGYEPTGTTKPFVEGVHIGAPRKPLQFLELKKPLTGRQR